MSGRSLCRNGMPPVCPGHAGAGPARRLLRLTPRVHRACPHPPAPPKAGRGPRSAERGLAKQGTRKPVPPPIPHTLPPAEAPHVRQKPVPQRYAAPPAPPEGSPAPHAHNFLKKGEKISSQHRLPCFSGMFLSFRALQPDIAENILPCTGRNGQGILFPQLLPPYEIERKSGRHSGMFKHIENDFPFITRR